jgi:hypothetical protein
MDELTNKEIELIRECSDKYLVFIRLTEKVLPYEKEIDKLINNGLLIPSKPNLIITRKLLENYKKVIDIK